MARQVGSELPTKVGEGPEAVSCMETFLILTVTALVLAIVTRGIGTNELVTNAEFSCSRFKQRRDVAFGIGETVGKLKAVVCLKTFHGYALSAKAFNNVMQEMCGGIGTLFGISSQNAVSGVFVDHRILIEFQSRFCDAGSGNDLYVDLDALAGVLHLFIRLGGVLLPGLFLRCQSFASENAPQTFDAAAVSSLAQAAPEFYDAELGIAAPHVSDELQLRFGVLVGMAVGTMRSACQRFYAAIIPCHPEVDVGRPFVILSAGTEHSEFLCMFHLECVIL